MLSTLAAGDNPLTHVVPHPVFRIGPVAVDNHMLMQTLAALLLICIVPMAVRQRRSSTPIGQLTPRGLGNFFETICNFLREEVARPALGKYTDLFIPYVWTVFFFILCCNLLGLLPINALLGGTIHLGGTATGNIYVTGALAACTLLMILVNGLRLGGWHFLAHFCPGPLALAPLLVPVEILGLGAKIFALAMRLFANMIAGHILLAVLVGFVSSAWAALGVTGGVLIAIPVVLGSAAINMLELFVAFLQAFIFTFLTCLFLGQAVVFEHGHQHSGDDHGSRHEPAAT
jgi:F-type H+-transporting ATPase subunit a